MWLTTDSLAGFYATPWGRQVAGFLAVYVERVWSDLGDDHVMGFGYCRPVFELMDAQPQRLALAVPHRAKPLAWPNEPNVDLSENRRHRVNLTLGVSEQMLPFRDKGLDKAIVLHGFEFSEDPLALADELYRVLNDQGEALVIVPNRAGLWSRTERAPFGYGSPFSPGQIGRTLQHAGFETNKLYGGLYFPPRPNRFVMRYAAQWDRLGGGWAKLVSGVLVLHLKKKYPPKPITEKRLDAFAKARDLLAGVSLRPEPAVRQPLPLPEKQRRRGLNAVSQKQRPNR